LDVHNRGCGIGGFESKGIDEEKKINLSSPQSFKIYQNYPP